MNFEDKKIREIAVKSTEIINLFLVDLIIRGTESNPVIEVFVDGEENVTAEECAKVSDGIKKVFDEENLFKSYRLDVSSPGVDRPLLYLQQYSKHVNRKFEVKYKSGEAVRKLNGKLIGVEENVLTFYNNTEIKVKFSDIIKAKVLVSFNKGDKIK
jgi:ribosome maturation factor RimP